MEDFVGEMFSRFATYSQEYPVIAGAFGIWALGVGTFLLRTVPFRVLKFLAKHTTTKLRITSTHTSYHDFLRWYEENNYSHNSRTIKISNGQYGYEDMIKAMGYGTHYFFFGWMPVRLTLSEKPTQASERERDEIEMTVLGRSHRTFDRIFQAVKAKRESNTEITEIMKYREGNWVRNSSQRRRELKSVCLNEGVREEIVGFIDSFKGREEFNLQHGIPHQTAIILYGPPGTGKTSVIKAIASHYNLAIFNLSPGALCVAASSFAALPENALVVIEDIDSNKALYDRGDKEKSQDDQKNSLKVLIDREGGFTSISEVLNAIDGFAVSHGRILIATTNHIEKLDPALLRSGRFDLKIEIGYSDNYAMKQFFERFFPTEEFPEDYQIKDRVCPADIQQAAIQHIEDPSKFLDEFREPKPAYQVLEV